MIILSPRTFLGPERLSTTLPATASPGAYVAPGLSNSTRKSCNFGILLMLRGGLCTLALYISTDVCGTQRPRVHWHDDWYCTSLSRVVVSCPAPLPPRAARYCASCAILFARKESKAHHQQRGVSTGHGIVRVRTLAAAAARQLCAPRTRQQSGGDWRVCRAGPVLPSLPLSGPALRAGFVTFSCRRVVGAKFETPACAVEF